MVRIYRKENVEYKNLSIGKKDYIAKHGYHFNDKLCNFAVSRMSYVDSNGKEKKLEPYDEYQIERLLKTYDVKIKNDILKDKVFVANMCKADYLNSSVPDEKYLAKYIKDVLDDVDGYEGIAFCRWLADVKHKGVNINWEQMI